jgi:hypothetical protein
MAGFALVHHPGLDGAAGSGQDSAQAARPAGLWGSPCDGTAPSQEDEPDQAVLPPGARQQTFTIHRPIVDILPALRAFAPTALYGFASYFAQLAARWVTACGRTWCSRRASCSTWPRRTIETGQRSGARHLRLYRGQGDRLAMLRREGYHVTTNWLLVEVASDDAAAGQRAGGW